jgi:CubicO group peptidase (beta-lactamase class C family)
MRVFILLGYLSCVFVLPSRIAAAGETNVFTAAECTAIESFLAEHVANSKSAMVVGLVDESGKRVFSAGTLDNGTERKPDGDSVFFIGSVSKTFTALLLLEMAQRGEVNLEDPVAKYLPAHVSMPEYDAKPIRLIDLATNTAGLPFNATNMRGKDDREQYESYTADEMLKFLAEFQLSCSPGTEYAYSNVGMALLGYALEQRAGKSYEALVEERICRPLGMDSTRIMLTPQLLARRAMGQEKDGQPSPPWTFQAYHPAGDIHSTVNDLLKYAAAHAGLTETPLAPLMEESHRFRFEDHGAGNQEIYMRMGRTATPWVDRNAHQSPGMDLRAHAGGAGSYHAWVGFDKAQRRGVVALTTCNDFSVEAVGWTILQRLQLTAERAQMFARELVGIGVALELTDGAEQLRITRVLPKTPAEKSGLTAGLRILKVDDVPTSGRNLTECTELLRGPQGSKVRLELFDSEKDVTTSVELTRERLST